MKQKLAILGASYLQLPLVLKANSLGIETVCIAWDDGKAICKEHANLFFDVSVLESDKILNLCDDLKVDGIITIATDICIPSIAYVANKMGLVGNSQRCALLTTNKSEMRSAFCKHGINTPNSSTIERGEVIESKSFNYPVVVKPVDRSGSLGVVKVFNHEYIKKAIDDAIECSFSKKCIVEEFIDGKEISVETLTINGEHHIIAITDKVVTEAPYFVELEHHQPSVIPQAIKNDVTEIALRVLNATEVQNGASHIEMLINDSGIFVIEIGSRMGGDFIGSDLVYLSTGFDYLEAVIKIALGDFSFNFNLINKYAGVYFLSRETDRLLNYFDGEYDYIVKKQILNSSLKSVKSSNDRSGYLIYQSDRKIRL